MCENDSSLWVFGYGSLCWKPGFQYGKSIVGSISGFVRRFWQGNVTHRGVPGKPGRVATLIEASQNESTFGVAFQLLGEDALKYLNNREVALGGYATHITTFLPRDKQQTPFPVLMYVATQDNEHWLGDSSIHSIAHQVVHSSGNSGHNVEYVVRLAIWMRKALPDVQDDHLFHLEGSVLRMLEEHSIELTDLIGEEEEEPESTSSDNDEAEQRKPKHKPDHFSSQVTKEKLRCIKM